MEGCFLVVGKSIPFFPHDLDNNVLEIAKMMGVDKDDLIKYGGDSFNSQQPGGSDSEQAVLTVAKMMGVSQDDLIKYG